MDSQILGWANMAMDAVELRQSWPLFWFCSACVAISALCSGWSGGWIEKRQAPQRPHTGDKPS